MKVLWFSPTPSNYHSVHTRSSSRGWISGLENQILKYPEIDLFVAFHSNEVNKVTYCNKGNVTYVLIPLGVKENKIERVISRWKGETYSKHFCQYYEAVVNEVVPDLIQMFGFEHPFGLISKETEIPIVIHIQGILDVINLFYFRGFSKIDMLKTISLKDFVLGRSMLHDYLRFRNKVKEENEITAKVKHFIGRTDFDYRFTKALKVEPYYYKCHEIMGELFYKSQWTKSQFSKPLKLFSTTGEAIYKGFDVIVESAERLCEIGFEFEWSIAGISKDSNVYKMAVQKVPGFGLRNLSLLGKLNTEELVNSILSADIFVNTSYIENSCNAIQEAEILGMPIIVSNTSNFIDGSTNGLLFQAGDYFSLAGAIRGLAENFEYAKELGVRARQKALRRNDPEAIGKRAIEIYRKVLERSSNKY